MEKESKSVNIMKKLYIAIGVVILLVFLALGCSGSNNSSDNTQTSGADEQTAQVNTQSNQTQDQTQNEDQTTSYKVGDKVVVGDRAYTITNVKTTQSVGDNEYTKKTATGIYVLVTMTIENTGKESSTMSSNDVKIVDSEGRTFESDSSAWTALKDNILLKQLQPGLPVNGETVFDVPKGIDATLQVTDGGWTTDPVNISLGTIE